MASFASLRERAYDRETRRQYYGAHLLGLNAYDRHKKFMTDYAYFYGKPSSSEGQRLPTKTDQDTLRESYRFIRTEEDDLEGSWEQRLAKRYYDKLFKEYCIADMANYKDGKIGLRWRVEKEVVSGKGQFLCGNKGCDEREGLSSYEVNFSYREAGETKQALVKLRVCPRCAKKLNYKREKERTKIQDTREMENRKRRNEANNDELKGKRDSPKPTQVSTKEREHKRAFESAISEGQRSTNPEEEEYFVGLFP